MPDVRSLLLAALRDALGRVVSEQVVLRRRPVQIEALRQGTIHLVGHTLR